MAKDKPSLGSLPDPTPGRHHGTGPPHAPPPPVPPARLPSEPDAAALLKERKDAEARERAEWDRLFGPGYVSDVQADRLHRVLAELAQRRVEGLRLYEPLPEQERFLRSKSRVRLARGGNRSGKTLCASVEVARAVTGQDPHGKYPPENGRAYCVGKNLDHVGQVQWRKLGRAGAFRMIRDEGTGVWRAFRPWQEYDAAYKEKSKEAPPLIPPRLVRSIAWESKAESIPSVVTLHNGWELAFYSSEGKPPQGSDLDLCLAGWSEIYDPVKDEMRRVDAITEPWHVLSFNEASGRIEARPAGRPFVKCWGEICRARLSNGHVLFTTRRHRVLGADGRWLSVGEAFAGQIPLRGVPPGASGCRASEEYVARSRGTFQTQAPIGSSSGSGTESATPRGPSTRGEGPTSAEGSPAAGAPTGSASAEGCPGRCSPCRRPGDGLPPRASEAGRGVRPSGGGVPRRSPPGSPSGAPAATPECSRPGCGGCCAAGACGPCGRGSAASASPPPAAREALAFAKLLCGLVSRRSSTPRRGTADRPPARQARGGGARTPSDAPGCRPRRASGAASGSSSRSGRVENRPPFAARRTARGGLRRRGTAGTGCGAGGGTSRHPSVFSGSDTAIHITSLEAVCQGPIWDISVPETHNYVYGGTISHNCWFDEEIVDEGWFPEMRSRILDRQGRLVWSATPQAGTDVLFDLHERAEAEAGLPLPRVAEFVILLADNPHLGEQEKADLAADLSEEERRVRIGGEYAVSSYKVYPSFSMALHGAEYPEGGVPDAWTRYAVVDPGHQVCAVLFAAVPPPGEGDFVYLYDELYLRDCDALKFGLAMREAVGAQRCHAFLMDSHFAMHTEAGAGKSVLEQYTAALRLNNVSSETTGHSFRLASDDVQGGITAVRSWLAVRQTGLPKLRAYRGRLPNFEWELKRYHMTVVKGLVTDRPRQKHNHLMDCTRYLAMADPRYVAPRARAARKSGGYAAWQALEKKANKGRGTAVRLGPGRKYA